MSQLLQQPLLKVLCEYYTYVLVTVLGSFPEKALTKSLVAFLHLSLPSLRALQLFSISGDRGLTVVGPHVLSAVSNTIWPCRAAGRISMEMIAKISMSVLLIDVCCSIDLRCVADVAR